MNTKTVIIIVVISSIISGFLSWGIVEKENWTLVVSATIVGASISYLGTVNFYMHNQFNKIEYLVEAYNNSLAKAKNRIDGLDKNNKKITKMIFNEELASIDLKLKKIHVNNEIVVEKSDVINIWTFLINNASRTFFASNFLPSDGWEYVNIDNGVTLQKKAIARGVDVKRINFFDYRVDKHKEGIKTVYNKHIEAGIPSSIKSIKDLDFTYNSIKQELTTTDVTFVDNELLLLTHMDEDFNIKYAILCFDENKIKSANLFFQKLFENFHHSTDANLSLLL